MVFADEDGEEAFCGFCHGMVGGFGCEEEGGEFNFVGSVQGVGGEDFEEALGEACVLEVGVEFIEIFIGDEVSDVLGGCGLAFGGHGRDFAKEGESHCGVFHIGLEDLIDLGFPDGWGGGFFWRGVGYGGGVG